MNKRILSIGQCGADHYGISTFLRSHFGADVEAAHSAKQALTALKNGRYDLVLVNRLLDRDGKPGVDIIRQIKADADLKAMPVMLVSNYDHAQQEATAAGAPPGFGKAQLDETATERLRAALETQNPVSPVGR